MSTIIGNVCYVYKNVDNYGACLVPEQAKLQDVSRNEFYILRPPSSIEKSLLGKTLDRNLFSPFRFFRGYDKDHNLIFYPVSKSTLKEQNLEAWSYEYYTLKDINEAIGTGFLGMGVRKPIIE